MVFGVENSYLAWIYLEEEVELQRAEGESTQVLLHLHANVTSIPDEQPQAGAPRISHHQDIKEANDFLRKVRINFYNDAVVWARVERFEEGGRLVVKVIVGIRIGIWVCMEKDARDDGDCGGRGAE